MEYQQGRDRQQLTLYTTCLDDMVGQENTVRAIDAFVNSLDLAELGFRVLPAQGRPPYNPADLLKLYLYGYMNRMRSSRVLELECARNIELIWLMGNLKPDHNTIARFRKDNPKAIKRVFRATVSFAKNHDLIGATLLAGDSTKLRAQNSKKNNYNKKKVARHIEYIDNKLAQHEKELVQADGYTYKQDEVKKEIKHRKAQRKKYEALAQRLEGDNSSENPQISTSDPDSRHQIVRGTITEVSYTAQTMVDEKHKLLVDGKLTAENDKKAMGMMLRRSKSILGSNHFIALFDKGYHTGSEFKIAYDLGVDTLVAIPEIGRTSQAPDPNYNAEHFLYDRHSDCYTCPQGHTLTSNGSWYKARNYRFRQFKTKACKGCAVRHLCTTAKQNGKIIQRSEFTTYIQGNKQRVALAPETYKKRQALVEHPFGTIKRQWGFDHIITKRGIEVASADFSLIITAYNLKRIFNILKRQGKTLVKGILEGIKRILTLTKPRMSPFSQLIHFLEEYQNHQTYYQLYNK